MDARQWSGEDDREFPKDAQPRPCEPLFCRDCAVEIFAGGVTTGVASGASCRDCYGWRKAHHLEHDERTIPQIAQAWRKVSA